MLDNAYKYEEELKALFFDTWYDEKYQYYYGGNFREVFSLPEEQKAPYYAFAVLNNEHEVIGYISYYVDNDVKRAYSFGMINFTDDACTFSAAIRQAIDDIFIKFGLNKLEFNMICGNPVERSYDRLVKKLGGRILCTRKDTAKLLNGDIVGDKMYEIMRKGYLRFKKRGNHSNGK